MLSEALTSRLNSGEGSDLQAIGQSPALRAELERSLPMMRAVATQKAGEDGVKAVIGRRFVLYPQPERSEGEWLAWWADYQAALAELPLESLEAGMAAYVAEPDSDFLPKPGRLRELARTAPTRSATVCYRASSALAHKPAALGSEISEADRDLVRRMASDAVAALTTPKLIREYSPPPLPTDAQGLTAEMRQAMARDRGDQA